MTDDDNKLKIDGLTKYEVDMLDKMWSLQTEEEFSEWYFTLTEEEADVVDKLKLMLIYALTDQMLEDFDDFQYSIANDYLKKFML